MFWDLETSQWNITSGQVLASFEKLLYSDHNMHCSTDHEFCFACTCQDLFACLFVVLKYVHLFFWIDTSVHLLVSHSTLGFWVLREWKITSTLSWVREKQNCSSPTIQYILFQFSKLKKSCSSEILSLFIFPLQQHSPKFHGYTHLSESRKHFVTAVRLVWNIFKSFANNSYFQTVILEEQFSTLLSYLHYDNLL